jgi:hypothetical protein
MADTAERVSCSLQSIATPYKTGRRYPWGEIRGKVTNVSSRADPASYQDILIVQG